ncbi:hypothetical protein CMUS01_10982 [Colletotrichum musicola]|uniref:Uncharacterized protein n=1 Tax=Colletotrichum musicola TaxID=2175873 RepID=A0A8H6K1L5_9PEZI|nr:hypothetical protein CMUS01_10982 [Colletotrichum musicola]
MNPCVRLAPDSDVGQDIDDVVAPRGPSTSHITFIFKGLSPGRVELVRPLRGLQSHETRGCYHKRQQNADSQFPVFYPDKMASRTPGEDPKAMASPQRSIATSHNLTLWQIEALEQQPLKLSHRTNQRRKRSGNSKGMQTPLSLSLRIAVDLSLRLAGMDKTLLQLPRGPEVPKLYKKKGQDNVE